MKRTSLRSDIPQTIRDTLSKDTFMSECIVVYDCEGPIQWHHAFTYAGKRVNEPWAIIPMCEKHHREEARYRQLIQKAIRWRIIYFDAIDDAAKKYPRSSIIQVML